MGATERSPIGSRGARALAPIVLAVFTATCDERGVGSVPHGEEHSSPPPVPTTGGCHNVEIDGACTLLGVTPITDGDDISAVPTAVSPGGVVRPDASANPDGTVTYLASYEMTPSDGRVQPRIRVRATTRDRPVLDQYFTAHRNARCAGVIINPPCPPGVQVVVQLPAPPVGTVLREP
jgi:hypothetical protein